MRLNDLKKTMPSLQRWELMYRTAISPESSTLGINVSHGHKSIGHFTVIDGSEAEGDLVLIQTFFALLWKLFLKNNS